MAPDNSTPHVGGLPFALRLLALELDRIDSNERENGETVDEDAPSIILSSLRGQYSTQWSRAGSSPRIARAVAAASARETRSCLAVP